MSWTQQTGPPLQQQQYPPTTTSLPAVAAGTVAQNSTAKFVQQQWQQPPQQQPYLFNQHQPHSMQPHQQPGSNQNNWFNPTLNAVPQQQQQQLQNNWQPQQLVSPPQANSEYLRTQPLQQHPPQLDNFMSIETRAIQQENSSHYQSIPTYPIQSALSNIPTLQQPNSIAGTENLTSDGATIMATNSQKQQHFEIFDNHQQQQQHQQQKPPQGNNNNNEGWDNEWEWNDNNQQTHLQVTTNQQLQQQSNPNIIEESFKNEPNDNWQWNIEDQSKHPQQQQQNMSIQPPPITTIGAATELKNNDIFNSLEGNVNENRRQSLENPQILNQISGSGGINSSTALNSRNFQSLPIDTSVSSPDNIQNPTSNNNVFVSQAKPVAQPPRQFASPPATSNSGNIDKIPSMPLPITTTISNPNMISHPISSQSPGLTNVPPPPAAQTPPQSGALPPPPPLLTQNKNIAATAPGNPFKRTGLPQHHRATGLISSVQPPPTMPPQKQPHQIQQQSTTAVNSFFAPPSSEEFQNLQSSLLSLTPGNQEILSSENSEIIINTERQFENQEIAPSNDRNQYLQTSHLSEEDFTSINNTGTHTTRIDGIGGQNNDNDNFPPPGLSRLVLGQPEIDNPNFNISEIPPGLDRMIPGTELVSSSILNLERQADGQDTIPSPRSAFTNVPPVELNDASSNIDITADRNLYLVPGESEHHVSLQPQPQRVVTGLENDTLLTQQNSGEQRELELDGENLEDVQQSQINQTNFQQNEVDISTRDEPLEGANTSDILANSSKITNNNNNNNNSNETESSLTIETHPKDQSNPSTANDESDNRNHFIKPSRRTAASDEKTIKKRGNIGNKENIDKRKERYESEESDISIERDRRRHHREGSMRNDRTDKDSRENIEKDRREKRESGNNRGGDRDERRRYGRDDKERHSGRDSKRNDRDRRDRVNDKYEKNGRDQRRYAGARYETDSKYETETSRYERNRKDGSDRDRDRERDRYDDQRRDDKDRRKYRRTGDSERQTDERRDRRRGAIERNDYREERSDRHRNRNDKTRIDYDKEYRKSGSGSRNAGDSDREKDRTTRTEKDSRYSQMYGYQTGYNYDAYAYYQQHQQYFEQLRRNNPQAYSEWYRKYYGAQAQSTDIGLTATDGRESVHSGRSSANNDKDRYSQHQQQYIPHHHSDYHRHFLHQQSNISSTPNVSMSIEQHQQPAFHLDLNLNKDYGSSSSTNLVQQQQQFQLNQFHSGISGYLGGGGSSTSGRVRSYYAQSEYSESRPENLSLNLIGDGAPLVNQEPQRMTPFKYTNDHSTVSFSAGLLICVKPKYSQNGITNIVKILRLGSNDSTRRLFQTFPGPLIRGLTHKKTIIEYCEDQIRLGPSTTIPSRQNSMSSLCSTNQMNKASFTLMWNLLILLLRQNGMVVGTDIAELLMKNKNQFPYEFTSSSVSATKSSSLRLAQTDASNETNTVESDSARKEKNINNNNVDDNNDNDDNNIYSDDDQLVDNEINIKLILSEQEITEKFRNYLLYGNVNEALEWATDHNLWGHALFLASKVDRRSHANVMMKFANKLQLNDPLQTLYQLMSGRTPSSVTSVQDEKWGDWRPHLSMILSNTSQRPDLDRKSITTLGDSLYNRGDLFAAQFCYLMAQVGFGKYSAVNPNETTFISNSQNNAVRLILLGSSHHKMFREFATNEAIMMTEIYEYACSLNDEKFSIVEFQPYKYLLATRMLDYGHQLKTLMYMEQIALHIQRDPSKYELSFIEKIYTLADRLKYYDPVLEKTMDDQNQSIGSDFLEGGGDVNQQTIGDQKWLQDLKCILNEYKPDLSHANYNNNLSNYQQQISGNGGVVDTIEQNRAAIDQQFVEINQQFSKLTMQYNNYDPMQQQQQEHQIGGDENQTNNLLQQQGQLNNTQQQQFSQFYNPNDANAGQIQIIPNDGINYDDSSYNGNNYIQSQQQNQGFEQQQQQFISLSDQQDSLSNGTGLSSQGNYEYWDQSQQSAQNESVKDKINIVDNNKKTSSPQICSDNIVQTNPVTKSTIIKSNINLINNKSINAATVITNKQNNNCIVHNNSAKLNIEKTSLSATSTANKQNTNNITFPPQIMKSLNNPILIPSFSTAASNSDIIKVIKSPNSSDVVKTYNPEKFNNYLPKLSSSLKQQSLQQNDDVSNCEKSLIEIPILKSITTAAKKPIQIMPLSGTAPIGNSSKKLDFNFFALTTTKKEDNLKDELKFPGNASQIFSNGSISSPISNNNTTTTFSTTTPISSPIIKRKIIEISSTTSSIFSTKSSIFTTSSLITKTASPNSKVVSSISKLDSPISASKQKHNSTCKEFFALSPPSIKLGTPASPSKFKHHPTCKEFSAASLPTTNIPTISSTLKLNHHPTCKEFTSLLDSKAINPTSVSKLKYLPNCKEIFDLRSRKSISKRRNLFEEDDNDESLALIKKSPNQFKYIVYNGTFPIDCPIKSRFDNDPEAQYNSNNSDNDDYDAEETDNDDENDDDDDDDDRNLSEKNRQTWSIQELYNDPTISCNYKKMCTDVENNLTEFEKFLSSKEAKTVRTFNIDEPI